MSLLLLIAAILLILSYSVRRRLEHQFAQDPRLRGPIVLQFTSQGLTSTGHNFTMRTSWKDLIRAERWEGHYLLYESEYSAHLIDRSGFLDGDEARFRQLLKEVGLPIKD
ncbi:MAG: YcxB family protein [Flavobacteriales bacterium]